MMKNSFFVLSLCAGLVACGGGGSSSNNNSPEEPNAQTGVFLDSAVANIGYRTETLDGVTNPLGEYEYIEGETVTFFIGDLELPAVSATEIVTPLEIAGSDDTSNSVVVNIIRLLQTLDEDGIPDNGITITETAKNSATQVDFSLTVAEFAASSAVINLVANSGSTNVSLVSENEAISHFESSLDQNFSIDLTGRTATSVITYSLCPSVPGGFDYSFANDSVTITGTDGWQTPACTLNASETFTLTLSELREFPDWVINCENYPICDIDDFDGIVSGVDTDDREFSEIREFDRASLTITATKSVEGTTFTEVITIE